MSSAGRHITMISSDEPVAISIGGGDGTWFRVLNWLIDSGVWASLSRSELAILGVLLRHRNQDGLVLGLSIEELGRLAGISKSQSYAAIASLRSHPARLLAHDKRCSLFEPLPGRTWAARRSGAPPGLAPPFRETVQLSEIPESIPAGRNIAPPLLPVPPLLRSEEKRDQKAAASARLPEPRDPDEERIAAAAALLRREGIEEPEAIALARSAGYETVRRVIANADELAERKQIRSSRRAYIANGVRAGYSLYEPLERKLADELKAKVAGIVDDELRDELSERDLASSRSIVRSGLISVAEIRDLAGAEIVKRIAARVKPLPISDKRRAIR